MKTYNGKTDNIKTDNVRIEKEVLDKAREYCKKNGIILTWLISRAVEKDLNDNRLPIVDGRHTEAQLTIDGD